MIAASRRFSLLDVPTVLRRGLPLPGGRDPYLVMLAFRAGVLLGLLRWS